MLDIHIFKSKEVSRAKFEMIQSLLPQDLKFIRFTFHEKYEVVLGKNPTIDELLEVVEKFRKSSAFRSACNLNFDTFAILVTDRVNSMNYFSYFDEQQPRNIFIHSAGWDAYLKYIEPKVNADAYATAFEIIANVLRSYVYDKKKKKYSFHISPVGCISDYRVDKSNVNVSIRVADICQDCLAMMTRKKLPTGVMQESLSILQELRKGLVFASKLIPQKEVRQIRLRVDDGFRILITAGVFVDEELVLKSKAKALYLYFLYRQATEPTRAGLTQADLKKDITTVFQFYKYFRDKGIEPNTQLLTRVVRNAAKNFSASLSHVNDEIELKGEIGKHFTIQGSGTRRIALKPEQVTIDTRNFERIINANRDEIPEDL